MKNLAYFAIAALAIAANAFAQSTPAGSSHSGQAPAHSTLSTTAIPSRGIDMLPIDTSITNIQVHNSTQGATLSRQEGIADNEINPLKVEAKRIQTERDIALKNLRDLKTQYSNARSGLISQNASTETGNLAYRAKLKELEQWNAQITSVRNAINSVNAQTNSYQQTAYYYSTSENCAQICYYCD